MNQSLFRQISSVFLIVLILCSTSVYAEPPVNAGGDSGSSPFVSTSSTVANNTDSDSTASSDVDSSVDLVGNNWSGFKPSQVNDCSSPEKTKDLSSKDVQGLLNLLKEGFLGEELRGLDTSSPVEKEPVLSDDEKKELSDEELAMKQSSVEGSVVKGDRRKSPHDSLIIPDEENKTAVEVNIPNEEIYPIELTHLLNNHLNGPYAFGIVLSDTLRTGRCKSIDDNSCSLNASNLKYRNSGVGIVADFKNVWSDLKGNCRTSDGKLCSASDWVSEKSSSVLNWMGKEVKVDSSDLDKVAAVADLSSKEALTYQTIRRKQSKTIPNSIKTDFFKASMSTNCEEAGSCYINTYSLFDKYFNSWSSADFTWSTFGPALKNASNRFFNYFGRRFGSFRSAKEKIISPLRQKLFNSNTFWGKHLQRRLESSKAKYGQIQQWWHEMTNPHYLMETARFSTFWGKSIAPGGVLDSLKTLDEKRHFVRMIKDLKTIIKANHAELDASAKRYQEIVKAFGVGSPEETQAVIQQGRSIARFLNDTLDNLGVNMDGPEWVIKNPFHGFYNKGVRQLNTNEVINMNEDPRHFKRILEKFQQDGHFFDFEKTAASSGIRSAYETDKLGRIVLYGVDPKSVKEAGAMSWGTIADSAKIGPERFLKDDWGQYQKVTPWSVDFAKRRITGNPKLYEGKWAPMVELSPEDLARRLNNGRLMANLDVMANYNVDLMLDTLRQRNFVERRYWSLLDRMLAQESELMRSYFGDFKGAMKWTAYPFLYRYAKQGFGMENFSHYMLPDSWTSIRFKLGREPVYNDAYIDFFARHGSDEGDIFSQVLNYLPWKKILDKVSENFFPLNDVYKDLTGEGGRNKVEDLVFYLNSPSECSHCSIDLSSPDFDKEDSFNEFYPVFNNTKGKFNAYILEYTKSAEARKIGQTLIAFAHHMDLSGDTGDITPKEEFEEEGKKKNTVINIAGDENTTCLEASKRALRKMPLIGSTKFFEKLGLTGSKSAIAIAGMENLAYVMFGLPGMTASFFTQTQITPELQDCIDAEGGYYVHYFASAFEKEKTDKKSPAKLSTDSVMDFINTQSDNLNKGFDSNNENSLTSKLFNKMKSEIDSFVKSSKKQDNVQAFLTFSGKSHGSLESTALFYLWVKGEMNPNKYREKGGVRIKDKFTGKEQVVNFKTGVKTFDGKQVVSNPDALRMLSTNTNGPFEEIPRYLNEICLISSEEPVLEINVKGESKILDSHLSSCLSDAIEHQTGLKLNNPDKLQDALGKITSVSTLIYPNISFGNQIIAEGYPRVEASALSKLILLGNMQTKIIDGEKQNPTGLLQAIQFENAVILLKPNGCLLVWVKHHNDGVLHKSSVKGIKPTLNKIKNEETGCEEIAVDLSMIPNMDSDLEKTKVNNFNESLKHMGPFQVFETSSKRYVFWSDETQDCKPYLRIIDKKTGEYKDIAIQPDTVKQTSTGLKFLDEDGKEHALDFGAEADGTPTISLDNETPETLIAAQGPKGSYWFDPETGLMYAENGQLLPLMEAFRKGIKTEAKGGEAVSNASGNTLNIDLAKPQDTLLDLPSLPENTIALITYLLGIILIITLIRRIE